MEKQLEKAIVELKNDGIVAIPTETVYGLAGNAFSEKAVSKIYRLKQRPPHNPLIVHLRSTDYLNTVAREIPDTAYQLADKFWPGPLTLVLKKHDSVPDIVTSGLDSVAVRIPAHQLTLKLLERLDFPLAAPSANPFGSISPTSAKHVTNYFGDKLNVILDGGECEKGIESTIVGFDKTGNPVVFRHGSISIEEMEDVIGKLNVFTHEEVKPNAPGMLSKHYAPATESCLTKDVSELMKLYEGKRIGLLLFKEKREDDSIIHQEVLSKTGNFREAAKNLYAAMHRLDEKKLDIIIFQQLPEKGLGITINDKLRRAAKK